MQKAALLFNYFFFSLNTNTLNAVEMRTYMYIYILFLQFFFYTEATNQSMSTEWKETKYLKWYLKHNCWLKRTNGTKKNSPKKENKKFNVRFLIFYLPFYLPIYVLCLFISYSLQFCCYSSMLTAIFIYFVSLVNSSLMYCSFKTHCNFLSFVALSNVCLLTIPLTLCFAIHLYNLIRWVICCFPPFFNILSEFQILQVIFPHFNCLFVNLSTSVLV